MGEVSEPIRVLCVDDDRGLGGLTVEMLEREESAIEAERLTAPGETLDSLAGDSFDCVVSDYDMPGMHGLSLLEEVRDEYPHLPFILFTARGSEQIASEAISAGVTEYLRKTLTRDQYTVLANRIRQCVERERERTRRLKAEEWYEQLFGQRLVGVGLSQNGIYREANELFAELLGHSREEIDGLPVLETVAPYDRERVKRVLQGDRRDEDRVRYTFDLHRPDGSTRTVEVMGGRVAYDGDTGLLGLIRPVGPLDSVPAEALADRLDAALTELETADTEHDTTDTRAHVERALELLSGDAEPDTRGIEPPSK
jgi:PAS domain S-box-containing protein